MTPTQISQLETIVGHLHAAKSQRSSSDDQIIADHIEEAYEVASTMLRNAYALNQKAA
jgi:hypothetical protein